MRIRKGMAFAIIGLVSTFSTGPALAQLTTNWEIAAGSVLWFQATGDAVRGLAYNPTTDHILVPSRASSVSVQILDAADGSVVGTLDLTGVTGGTFAVNEIAIDDNGVIYVCNLVLAGSAASFRIYRWADESSTPTVAFDANDTTPEINGRTGDVMGLRGTGTNTVLYVGGTGNAILEVFTTADGVNFVAGTDIDPNSVVGAGFEPRSGIAPRSDNTDIWLNDAGDPLELFQNDGTSLGQVNTGVVGSGAASVDFWDATTIGRKLLAVQDGGVNTGRVVDVTGGVGAAALIDTIVPSVTGNTNGNAAGQAEWDTLRGAVILLSTNNIIGSYGSTAEVPVELSAMGIE